MVVLSKSKKYIATRVKSVTIPHHLWQELAR